MGGLAGAWKPYDLATGFTYLRNRQYAPALGRFTSPDPLGAAVGDPMSLNAYVYALSNPLTWVDPLGLSPLDASPMVATASEAKINTSFLGGFVKGFVKTAAVATGVIIAAAAAPVTTAVVGTGLAVYGTISNYQQRATEQIAAGKKVNKVGTFFAALGDTLGVTGLIEGVTGKRLLTGTQLTSAQAGESLGSGAASVAAMVAGPVLVKTIKPVVSKIVEPLKTVVANAATTVKNAVGSLFSNAISAAKAVVSPQRVETAAYDVGGTLSQASQDAYRAARNVDQFDVSSKHLASAEGDWAKFSTNSRTQVRSMVSEALQSQNAEFHPNSREGSFSVVTGMGRQIGTRGQTRVKVVVGTGGRVWTAYPVK